MLPASLRKLGLNRRIQYSALALVVLSLLVLLLQTLRKAYRTGGYDFTSYLLSARALIDGTNPYSVDTPFPYLYPLFLAFTLLPLTLLPYWVATVTWFFLSVIALFVSCTELVNAAADEIKTRIGGHLAVPGLLIFLIVLSPLQNNFLNGQVNLIVLACCVLFFDSFSRNRVTAGAVWLGAAIALKLLPAVLLAFLLVRRRFSFASLTIAFAILFCLLPGLLVGTKLISYYASYGNSFLLRGLTAVGASGGSGFNLQSVLASFDPSFGHSIWMRSLSLLVSTGLVLTVELAVIRSPRAQPHVWAFCAYLIGCLLLSPLGETHHLVFAFPAILLIGIKAAFDGDWMTPRVRAAIGCFLLAFVVLPKVVGATPVYFLPLSILIWLLFLATQGRAEGSVEISRAPES